MGSTFYSSRFELPLATRGVQVVLMNQVTTKVLGGDQAKMVPALGARPAG